MDFKFEDIRIESFCDGYTMGYKSSWIDFSGKNKTGESTLAYWEMSKLIVSMGDIKIKNYIGKNFKLTEKSYTHTPVFETKEEAEKCYEWLKQKVFEATLVGTENLKAEQDRKREEEKVQREIREKNKVIKDANIAIEKFQQYIGKEISFPVLIGYFVMNFKATLLNISFNNDTKMYIVNTSAGYFELYHKNIEIKDNEIISLVGGYHHEPKIPLNGKLNIIF